MSKTNKSNKSDFQAPISKLRTSWVQMAFSKPKSTGVMVKRSLSSRSTPVIKSQGRTTSLSQDFSY